LLLIVRSHFQNSNTVCQAQVGQRVPRKLHARLIEAARKESVSLNQFVTSILSEAIAGKTIDVLFKKILENSKLGATKDRGELAALWRPEKCASIAI